MKIRKIVVSLLIVMLICGMSFPTNADIVTSSKIISTIDPQLQTILQGASSDERIPVDVWLYETSTNQDREQKIFSKTGFNKATITLDTKNTASAEKVDEYIAIEREVYAAEMAQQYATLRLEYADIQALQTTRKTDTRLFYSRYAPMISTELTPAEIKLIARDTRVQAIYYSPIMVFEPTSNTSVQSIRANYTRDTLGYTGNGIKIGLLEARGLPNKENDYYNEDKIFYDPDVTQTQFDDHADLVAAIMVSQSVTVDGITYEGIVPDAELYATFTGNGGHPDWRAAVEWLLSQNVNVINHSAGSPDNCSNIYGTQEKWFDHVAINHSVHFVQASGNDSNHNVRSPGMAYNIITVGSIDDNDTTTSGDDSLANDSCYLEQVQLKLTNKPDLVAPGVCINSAAYDPETCAYDNSGTSYAAPHVTAVIAQLCQRRPTLKVQQDAMKAILTASIPHSEHAYTPKAVNYDLYGAGVIDARSAFYTSDNYRFTSGSFAANSADGTEKTYTFTVSSTDNKIRVSLSWLKYAVLSQTEATHPSENPVDSSLANLSLLVYAPGSIAPLDYSDTLYSNTEIVEFTPQITGTYRIVVKQVTHSNKYVYFAVAWW